MPLLIDKADSKVSGSPMALITMGEFIETPFTSI